MDTAQWPQEIVVKPMEEIVVPNNTSKPSSSSSSLERRARPQKEQAINCPRCNSTNTKFCYYNNYSLSQPRYFCKTCRRYWTEGGSLRNIPVGGGSRKNKRSSSSNSSSSNISNSNNHPAAKKLNLPDLVQASSQNPKLMYDHGQDLNLGFPSTNDFKTISELIQVPNFDGNNKAHLPNSTTNSTTTTPNNTSHLSALELLTGITTRGLNSFMPMPMPDPNTVYSSGFPMPEFKVPSLSFSLDGIGGSSHGYGISLQGGVQENSSSGRLLFPFEDLKHVSNTTTHQDHVEPTRDHQNGDSNGYWNGMLGGGSW